MRGYEVQLALTALAVAMVLWRRPLLPRWRTVVLIVSVVILGFLRLDLPSIHCIAEGFFSRMTVAFLKLPMVLKLGVAFLPALFFGRIFCGYVCPKGAAQELLLIRRLRLRVPPRLDATLRLVPYLSLAALIVFPVVYEYRLWTDLDPFLWLFQGHGHLPGLIVLGVVIPTSFVLCRPFCRYLCPMVPIFRLLSRLAPVRRVADAERCRGCKTGRKACDYDVIRLEVPREPSEGEGASKKARCRFDVAECLQCGRCQARCPRDAIR